ATEVDETSGLGASRSAPGAFWIHNDSGDTERVFAIDGSGKPLGTYEISDDKQEDWEDITVGPGPAAGKTYLYVGSIGGNNGRTDVSVFRAPEPPLSLVQAPAVRPLLNVDRLDFRYPNAGSFDAETLMVDPLTQDLFIVTKDKITGRSIVFRAAAPQAPGPTRELEQVAEINFPNQGLLGAATGGDISPNGLEIVIRTYGDAFLWQRSANQSIA
ncbi:MAG: hypothetical protein KC416_17855, partial [Myxococcales bacterium]|nr:hypothetical protein [Myxococcales bacterium]